MTACKTDIDWSTRPSPWREIAARFRDDCKRIAAGLPLIRPIGGAPASHVMLQRRRRVLGIGIAKIADLAGISTQSARNVEEGRAGSEALRKYRGALSDLEAGK